MRYIAFDARKPLDLVCLGRIAIDFNPAYSDAVQEGFQPLKQVHYFEKYGGSPANIPVGVTRHGMKAGFFARVSDDQFGDYVIDYFRESGIDTSRITRCTGGEKLGLTFTEMLSPQESAILMYQNQAADLQLSAGDIDEAYIRDTKALLISGTSLAESPSREAALKAAMLARKNGTVLIFDIDFRPYNWKSEDEISIYYSAVARDADIIMGSREEFDLTERLIRPGMSDRESADYWNGRNPSHGYRWLNAKIRLDKELVFSDPYAHKCCKTAGIKSKSKHYQGSVYASKAYNELLPMYGFMRSMSRAGTPTDNAAMESINGWIKAELFMDLHVTGEKSVAEEIDDYIRFFNEQRPAYSLGYLTPRQYRERYTSVL